MRWPAFALGSLLLVAPGCSRSEPRDPALSPPSAPLAPKGDPIVHVPLGGSGFQALPTRDGAWVFVSITAPDAGSPGIALYRRGDDGLSFVRRVPLDEAPAGMVLTHDGKLLIAAAGNRLAFLDVERLTGGREDAVLGALVEPGGKLGRIYVNVTADDRTLFCSDESARTITVVDLEKARASGFLPSAVIGKIPVGNAPIALTFSPDGRTLYTTSQGMPDLGWPRKCRPEGSSPETPPNHPEGAVIVVDVERAKVDPPHAVVGTIPAGCNPVRLVLSPGGDVAYVSARGMDELLAFDTKKLLAEPARALVGRVPVGPSPVGVAVIDGGRRVLVTSSNRFSSKPTDRQPLFVIDTARIAEGAAAVVGTLPAGAFPREMRVTADGQTLYLTNFVSKTLQVVDLTRLPVTPR